MDLEDRLRTHLREHTDDWSGGLPDMVAVSRDPDRLRLRPQLSAVLSVVLLVAIGATASVAVVKGLEARSPTSRPHVQALSLARTASMIDQFAVNVSAASGLSSPASVAWVETTRGAANTAIMQSTTDTSTSSEDVYALEIYDGGSGPGYPQPAGDHFPGAPARTYHYLLVIATTSNLQLTDIGFSTTDPTLASLGTPTTDSLSGISPGSMAKLRSTYNLSAPVRP